MKARVAHVFGEAPIGFIGAVLAIALVFRLGIGVMKPATEPDMPAPVALHTPPPDAKAVAKAEAKPAAAPIITDALPTIEPAPAVTASAKASKRKPPRSFGKR